MGFAERVKTLPTLGIGLSTEFGASQAPSALDVDRLVSEHPGYASFLEVGIEVARGIDAACTRWIAGGRPTTYHFLDLNLDDAKDFDASWIAGMRALLSTIQPRWLCGDAGTWHIGRRDRSQMLLLPPILSRDSAARYAEGVVALRDATGLEVLPENPPGTAFIGDLHVLDFFALVADLADTGLLLDTAHLAIFQRTRGLSPLTGLDGFPLDRVVELHVAGGTERRHKGRTILEDDHGPRPHADTWAILDWVAKTAHSLRAVVFECERRPLDAVLPAFRRIEAVLRDAGSPVLAGAP